MVGVKAVIDLAGSHIVICYLSSFVVHCGVCAYGLVSYLIFLITPLFYKCM